VTDSTRHRGFAFPYNMGGEGSRQKFFPGEGKGFAIIMSNNCPRRAIKKKEEKFESEDGGKRKNFGNGGFDRKTNRQSREGKKGAVPKIQASIRQTANRGELGGAKEIEQAFFYKGIFGPTRNNGRNGAIVAENRSLPSRREKKGE